MASLRIHFRCGNGMKMILRPPPWGRDGIAIPPRPKDGVGRDSAFGSFLLILTISEDFVGFWRILIILDDFGGFWSTWDHLGHFGQFWLIFGD